MSSPRRLWSAVLTTGILTLGLHTLGGCETHQPGVSNTAGSYSALIRANPDKAIKSAERAAEDLKLIKISSEVTGVDGKFVARTHQDTRVTVTAVKEGDGISNVTVRVGATGDEMLSQQILARIRKDFD